jgi:predicted RNase H-like HicB family nuclease
MKNRIKTDKQGLDLNVEVLLFKEGEHWISFAPSLKLSSFGDTEKEARVNFKEALDLFMEHTLKKGTLERVLIDCGWMLAKSNYAPPPSMQETIIPLLQRSKPPKTFTHRIAI